MLRISLLNSYIFVLFGSVRSEDRCSAEPPKSPKWPISAEPKNRTEVRSLTRSNDLQVDFIYNNYVDNPNTLIYYWKRNKWVNGPKLISGAGLINGRRATTAINSTAALTIFQVIHEEQEKDELATYVYNFATEGWTKFPSIEINVHNLLVAHLSSTTLICKKSKKVFLHVRFRCLIASFSLTINSVKWLFSYDLKNGSNGEWLIERQSPTCQEREAKGRQYEFSDLKIHIFFVNLQKCMLPCMQFKDCYTHSIALHLFNLPATFTAMVFGLQSTPPFLLNLKFKVLSPNMPFLITHTRKSKIVMKLS